MGLKRHHSTKPPRSGDQVDLSVLMSEECQARRNYSGKALISRTPAA